MDSAKEIARDMLNAVHVDGSGFLGAVAKGFISFPVSFGYLGYDFIDSEHRRENLDDKIRFAEMLKVVTINEETISHIVRPFIDDFTSRVGIENTFDELNKISGQMAGSLLSLSWQGLILARPYQHEASRLFFQVRYLGSSWWLVQRSHVLYIHQEP